MMRIALSRTVIMRIDSRTEKKIATRKSWPVAELARLIGCTKTPLYRLISHDVLTVERCPEIRVLSSSVVAARKMWKEIVEFSAYSHRIRFSCRAEPPNPALEISGFALCQGGEPSGIAVERSLRRRLRALGYTLSDFGHTPGPIKKNMMYSGQVGADKLIYCFFSVQ